MRKSIIVTFHSGQEELNELITKLVFIKLANGFKLEQFHNNIHTTTNHEEK
ncbi:hypothetical protein JMF89_01525 [Clostridiaceae bacterium UIB06]|uniref:Uncharacterized protein n=1 Tax=Clostridium thailandense TaxID=2794346 RepID=A0A949WQ84_9CLOT|nr:hypothetical protein [Clostridium thailandense]MBV7272390.1 hypothetical protein [Clostridium thailandense]MCH5135895.1 hypothetical protein [Clostridiaceae bacterium UIB06]